MKKWYRLIKEYPGSLKLGTLVSEIIYKGEYTDGDFIIHYSLVENQPEYWEELPLFLKHTTGSGYFQVHSWYYDFNRVLSFHGCKNSNGTWLNKGNTNLGIYKPITKQEYLESFGYKVGDVLPNNVINAWCQNKKYKIIEDIAKPYWDKTLNNPDFGFTCVVRDLDIIDNTPVFIIGSSYALQLEDFKEFISSYKPKLTFGGHEVTVDGESVTCKGETGTKEELKAIKSGVEELFLPINLSFGNHYLEKIEGVDKDWSINIRVNKSTSEDMLVKIGCTTGTWKELCDIINYIK